MKSEHSLFFFSAACSFKLLIKAATLHCCCVALLGISFTEFEYFAIAATMKRRHHSSQFVLGTASVESQNGDNPDTADDARMLLLPRYLTNLAASC